MARIKGHDSTFDGLREDFRAKRGRDASPGRPPMVGRARIADVPAKGGPAVRPYRRPSDAKEFVADGLSEYRLIDAPGDLSVRDEPTLL